MSYDEISLLERLDTNFNLKKFVFQFRTNLEREIIFSTSSLLIEIVVKTSENQNLLFVIILEELSRSDPDHQKKGKRGVSEVDIVRSGNLFNNIFF
jgi:hypothetical protein